MDHGFTPHLICAYGGTTCSSSTNSTVQRIMASLFMTSWIFLTPWAQYRSSFLFVTPSAPSSPMATFSRMPLASFASRIQMPNLRRSHFLRCFWQLLVREQQMPKEKDCDSLGLCPRHVNIFLLDLQLSVFAMFFVLLLTLRRSAETLKGLAKFWGQTSVPLCNSTHEGGSLPR